MLGMPSQLFLVGLVLVASILYGRMLVRFFDVSALLDPLNVFPRSLSVVVLAALTLIGCKRPSDSEGQTQTDGPALERDHEIPGHPVGVVHVTQGRWQLILQQDRYVMPHRQCILGLL